MNKNSINISQFVLVVAALVGVVGFYFFGRTIPKPATSNDTEQVLNSESINLQSIEQDAIAQLTTEENAEWESLAGEDDLTKANFWSSIDRNDLAAIYRGKWATEQNDATNWNSAGDLYVRAYRETADEQIKHYFLDRAVQAYQTVLSSEENNETKLKLAQVFIDARGEVMRGVLLLQQIVEDNPSHIQANYELGMLSIRSGQTEKALNRFKVVIEEQPDFIEPYIYVAQLLMEKSDKDGAIVILEQAMSNAQTEEQKVALSNIKKSIINN